VVVYRAGDIFWAWSFTGLTQVLGIGLGGVAAIGGGIAMIWTALALRLGRVFDAEVPSEIDQVYNLTKKEEAEAVEFNKENDARLDAMLYGAYASKIVCPHCNIKGQVRKRRKEITDESREKGIIGAIIGRKIITKKGSATQLHCDNCDVTWTA